MNILYPGFRKIVPYSSERLPVEQKQADLPPKTVGELIDIFEEELVQNGKKDQFSGYQSVIVNYLVPAFKKELSGLQKTKQKRISPKEIFAARNYLRTVPLQENFDLVALAKPFVCELEEKKQNQKLYYLRNLMKWAIAKNWLIDTQNQRYVYSFKEATKSRPYISDTKLTSRGKVEAYILGSKPEHFDEQGHLVSAEFEESLQKFQTFLEDQLDHRQTTAKFNIDNLKRLLGWMNQELNIPINQLSLHTLVPYRKLKYYQWETEIKDESGNTDFYKKFLLVEKARENSENDGEWLIEQVSQFVNLKKMDSKSAIHYYDTMISLGKFIYHKETKDFVGIRGGFTDIPFIRIVNNARRRLDQKKRAGEVVIPRHKRTIPWEDVLEVLEKLRIEATLPNRYNVRKNRIKADGSNYIDIIKRTDNARAMYFCRFLALAISVALPPRRPRVYRELELGRTFVYGELDGIAFTKKDYKSEQGCWYIYLRPDDYKTGKTYGEQWLPLPNITYRDQNTLYSYIEEWLEVWRPVFNPQCNNVFITREGKPLIPRGWTGLIKHSIHRFTGVPVNPHSLRHIFVTYLKRIGATEQELEAAAWAQAQSRLMQTRTYDTQDKQEKMQPIFELVQQVQQEKFKQMSLELNSINLVDSQKSYPSKREAFHKVLGNSKTIGDQVYNEMFPEEKTVDAQKWWKTDGNNENDNAFKEILKLLPELNKEEEANLKRLLN